jgi:hypothetical protein
MSVQRVTTGATLKELGSNLLKNMIRNAAYPGENILHDYRTFNYRVTLAVVSPEELKSGSYKTAGFSNPIFVSHGKGTGPAQTKGPSQTLNKLQSIVNTLNQSANANYDYYLEDLYIKNFIGKSRDWSTEIRLKIVEPYSLDTFLTNIIAALTVKGYKNFDKSNAFVLKIDFVGYHEDSTTPELIPYTTRFYPMIITHMEAKLTQQGTTWEIKGVPVNQTGTYDDSNKINQELNVAGTTVREVMKDLELTLDTIQKTAEEKTGHKYNRYKIEFHDEKGNVTDNSVYANALMFDPFKDASNKEFTRTSYITGVVQAGEQPENVKPTLTIPGSLGLTKIIDAIIQDSLYVTEKIKTQFQGDFNKGGWINWWRVVTKVENLPVHDTARNITPKLITFQIIPRKVHYTKLSSIFVPTYKPPASDYEGMTARRYEWQYTGKNKDILSFNLNFNQMWTKLITGNFGVSTDVPGASGGQLTEKQVVGPKAVSGGPPSTPSDLNPTNVTPNPNNDRQELAVKGANQPDPLFTLARDINSLMNNPYENIELNMEILGDPMWLGTQYIDSGNKIDGGSTLFTVDGGIALRSVDPVIRVIAYAPKDFNSQGFLTSGEANEDKALSRLSAYYTVREVESTFSNGTFKQKLIGTRNVSQDLAASQKIQSFSDRFSLNQINLT